MWNCGNGCGNNCWWIIILLLLICGCGCDNGCGNGCGCDNGCGGNNCWWIIILLLLFCNGCGCDNGCTCGSAGNNTCVAAAAANKENAGGKKNCLRPLISGSLVNPLEEKFWSAPIFGPWIIFSGRILPPWRRSGWGRAGNIPGIPASGCGYIWRLCPGCERLPAWTSRRYSRRIRYRRAQRKR